MSDLSDKYKNILDSREISPDFKERTAEMMIKLRDSQNNKDNDAADNTQSVKINLEGSEVSRRITAFKTVSAVAAAAACVALCAVLGKGVYDRNTDISTVESATVSESAALPETEQTIQEQAPAITVPEAEAIKTIEKDNEAAKPEDDSAAETTPVTESPAIQEEAPEMEEAPLTDKQDVQSVAEEAAPSHAENTSGAPVPKVTDADTFDEPDEAIEGGITPDYSYSAEGMETPLDPSLPLVPAEDEYGSYLPSAEQEEAEYEEEEAVDEEEEAIIDEAPDALTAAAPVFSPKEVVTAFKAQNSTLVITPVSEDTKSSYGSVTSYSTKTVRDVTTVKNFTAKLYGFEDTEAAVSAYAPNDSRFIIDVSDKQGNAMRIYFGSRYICYSHDGSYYSFELTEDEYNKLDNAIIKLIK